MRKLGLAAMTCALVASAATLSATAGPGQRHLTNGPIMFAATVNGTSQVFKINPDGSGLTQLTHATNAAGEYGSDWSPDGSTIVFEQTEDKDVLYKANADGSSVAQISAPCRGKCLGDDDPAFNRSGTKLAFDRAFGPIKNNSAAHLAIYAMNADGSGLTQITQKNTPAFSTEDHKPTWAPDGSKLAFQRINTSVTPKNVGAIYVTNPDGTHIRRLTPLTMNAGDPHWSPDGTKILFNNYDEIVAGKDANLFTIRPDGTGLRQVTHYTGGTIQAYASDWSPDGKKILFHLRGPDQNKGTNQFFVANTDGSHIVQITHVGPSAHPTHAAWGAAH